MWFIKKVRHYLLLHCICDSSNSLVRLSLDSKRAPHLFFPSAAMSLAFALFGAPRYPTEEAPDDPRYAQLAQYNTDQPAHDYHGRHGIRLANTPTWRAKRGSDYSDVPPHKHLRGDMMLPPLQTAPSPLVPAQPASPPPAHILRAGMYANSTAESPSRADKILRWISYAIRFGGLSLGIEVVNGWAHLHELAKAATSVRKDFAGLTPGALRNIIELDVSGRWWLSGGCVCKVPRSARCSDTFSTLKDEAQDSLLHLCDSTPPLIETEKESMSASWASFG